MMDHVQRLEDASVYILREAYARYPRIALLWSMGKDSTVLVWLARKAFFGKIPFPIIHIDTTYKFPEMYRFRDEYAQRWGLQVLVSRNEQALQAQMKPQQGHFTCCDALKTHALQQ
ncbi:MAG: phosphoadenosine phosphosulfate reductase family protein, partial [Candidatus Omnitrophica bacterium]|nr:phosphoadenosine phosphosulfate reductase family protein [Candidatus Omnitrophota bacterium]